MKHTLQLAWLPIAVGILISASSNAAVPQLISYQGRLTNSVGAPLDTTVALVFQIYADSNGVTSLWDETHPSVVIADGLFQVLLGSVSPLSESVFDGSRRWLGVQLEGGSAPNEFVPIVSVAYAYRATKSDTSSYALFSGGASGSGWIDDGTTVKLTTITDNVGIGNDSPVTKLHVGQSATGNQMAQIEGLTVIRTNASGRPTNLRLVNLNGGSGSGTSLDFQGLNSSSMTKDAARISGYITDQTPLSEKSSLTFSTNDAADDGLAERMRIDRDGNVGIGYSNPVYRLDIAGGLRATDSIQTNKIFLGKPSTTTGALNLYSSLTSDPIVQLFGSSAGGTVQVRDEAGNPSAYLKSSTEPGGLLSIARDAAGTAGFYVDGNTVGTEEPKVSVLGSSRSVILDMSESGDSSVMLPYSSISNTEMLNEAGIANTKHSSTTVTLDNTIKTIASRKMSFPTSGYALVIATAYLDFWHIAGTFDQFRFAVSDVAGSIPTDQNYYKDYPAAWDTFNFQDFFTIHGYFSVEAGTQTFYLLGTGAGTSPWVGDCNLTVAFFPTWYGSLLKAGEADPPERDQEQADADSAARMQAQIDRLREEFDAKLKAIEEEMKKQLDSGGK